MKRPDSGIGAVSDALARNVRRLRETRRWTLDQLAARSRVSKGMVVQMERGATNPSIATLCRLANAFGVTVPRLVEAAEPHGVRLVRSEDAVTLWRSRAGGVARLLAGLEVPELAELWEWSLAPRDVHAGEPHPRGSHEMLHVLKGALTLQVDGTRHEAGSGETIVFRADRPHVYSNAGKLLARFLMLVLEPVTATPALAGTQRPSGRRKLRNTIGGKRQAVARLRTGVLRAKRSR
jgi:transcriptional regulator with XRE-family HTH domain